jgi:hypothetical protein
MLYYVQVFSTTNVLYILVAMFRSRRGLPHLAIIVLAVCLLSDSTADVTNAKERNIFPFYTSKSSCFINCYQKWWQTSRDSSVGIATGYWLDDRGFGVPSPGGVKNFYFSMSSKPALGSTRPPTRWVSEALSPVVKREGCEVDHLPPSSAEVKKTLGPYMHSPIRLHGVVLN